MARLTLRGVNGSIRWNYLLAASVQQWMIAPANTDSFTLSASLSEVNSYHLSQQPLTFVVPVKGAVWTWPILSLAMTGTTAITATLGPLGPSSKG